MGKKPTAAFYWCSSCGGCEETVVDLDEKVLDVVAAIDIVFWPCAMDHKYSDIEAMPDGAITISFINGAIRTSEQEHIARLLRKKSTLVVAFGSCSSMGGIPALANLKSKQTILEQAYCKAPTVVNPKGIIPGNSANGEIDTMDLPEFYDTVYNLGDIIEVDYFLPGCPPTPKLLAEAVTAALEGTLPEKGSILLPNTSLCGSCDRNESKPDNLTMDTLHRIHEIVADPETCFLAQGVLCMGPATRDGCDYPCVKGNMPCSGCFGPVEGADQGAKMIGAIGGIVQSDTEKETDNLLESIPDPAGTFYRYSLSSSLLGSKRERKNNG